MTAHVLQLLAESKFTCLIYTAVSQDLLSSPNKRSVNGTKASPTASVGIVLTISANHQHCQSKSQRGDRTEGAAGTEGLVNKHEFAKECGSIWAISG